LKASVAHDLGKALAPKEIVFVTDIPKTRNAKVMRRIVRSAYLGESSATLRRWKARHRWIKSSAWRQRRTRYSLPYQTNQTRNGRAGSSLHAGGNHGNGAHLFEFLQGKL
jgi:uncharacterized protein YjcR